MEKPSVGIFWDFENVHPPTGISGYEVVGKIWKFVEPFGIVSTFKAYMDVNKEAGKAKQQHELQSSGVSIIHTPHNGKKEAADKILIVDLMLFALETPCPKIIVLITGDQGFHYATSVLRLKGHKIYIVHPHIKPPSKLAHSTYGLFDWKTDILERTGVVEGTHPIPPAVATVVSISQASSSTNVFPDNSESLKHNTLANTSLSNRTEGNAATASPSVGSDHGLMPVKSEDHVSALRNLEDGNNRSSEATGLRGYEKQIELSSEIPLTAHPSCADGDNEIPPSASPREPCNVKTILDSREIIDLTDEPDLLSSEAQSFPDVQGPPATSPHIESLPILSDSSIPDAMSQPSKPLILAATDSSSVPPSSTDSPHSMEPFKTLVDILNQMGASTTRPVKQDLVWQAIKARFGNMKKLKMMGYTIGSFYEKAEELGLICLSSQIEKTGKRKMKPISYLNLAPGAEIRPTSTAEASSPPQTATLEDLDQGPSNTTTSEVDSKLLIDVLKSLGASHGRSFKRAVVAKTLLCRDAGVFGRFGISQKQYFEIAIAAGIIRLVERGKRGSMNIALAPAYY